jgi:DNA-binding CsgD family transcriptional regulator
MKEVAYILQITTGTAAFHKYQIMHMLGAKSIDYAIMHHMIARR